MRPRALVAWGLLAATVAAVWVFRERAGGLSWSREKEVLPATEPVPGLAPAAGARVAPTAPEAPSGALPPEIEEMIKRLVEAESRVGSLVFSETIEALSVAICVEGGAHGQLLRRAVGPNLTERVSRALILAIGRCGREDALRALVALLEAPDTSLRDRESVLLALAQPRQARVDFVGVVVLGIGDAQLTGPIREPFVVDALLETLAKASRESPGRGLWHTCTMVLTGTAGASDDVFDALVASTQGDPDRVRHLLFALGRAGPSVRIAEYARRHVVAPESEKESLRGAMNLWVKAERAQAFAYVRTELASADVSDVRKALLLNALDGLGQVPDDEIPALERLVSEVRSWAQAHPRVVTHYVKQVMPEGAPPTPEEMDVVRRAATFAIQAYRSARHPSSLLRTFAVEGMLTRLAGDGTAADPLGRRPPRWMTNNFAGDDPFVLDLLERLRSAPVADDTLVDVLDAILTSRSLSLSGEHAVAKAAALVAERLPRAVREEFVKRQRRRGG